MTLPALSLAVVGADYDNEDKARSNRRFEIALCRPGDPIELVPDPKNKADSSAVAVLSERGIQIGYVTAERCGRIGALIRSGHELRAVFQQAAPYGCVIRVAFDGELPVVDLAAQPIRPRPELAEGADPDFDFEPDADWPD
ncbi:HIRAN domain-containing protein [Novosphingobium sp. SL115]|uniref:HIRAN domain-containing protein n=1 Tax=Novosphingobium sp. SL115 TaxID=2995150 RepID=UPI002274B0DB|nr:HIRAN domain-containing protein [Novosphingobium sp. SL115]MCY1672136.1 HIRAN domain-containing protein [Novosphingobium sp. SL115]